MAVQFKLCLDKDGGVITPQLLELVRNQSLRFIPQLCVEEMFNRVKNNVSQSVNTRCTPQRAMAVAIGAGVPSKINRFPEVSRDTQSVEKGFAFDEHTFRPQLRLKNMSEEMQATKVNSIVGYGEADWFSPNASNSASPLADILACRHLKGRVEKLETTWLSRLASARMLLRRKGETTWMLPVGNICATIVKIWPVKASGDLYDVDTDNGAKSATIAITDPAEW